MKKEERLLSRVMTLGIGAGISKATVFFLMPLYTAVLTPASFGKAEIIINTALLLIPFVSLAAPEAVFRFLAGGKGEKTVLSVGKRMLFTGFFALLVLLPFLSLVESLRPYLFYLFCYVVAAVLHSFLSHILRARGDYTFYAIQQLFCTFLTVALSFLFLPVLGLAERGYLMAIFLADALTAVLLGFYLFFKRQDAREEENALARPMWRYALPLIPTTALWWVISYCDRFVLLSHHGAAAIGLYAAAGRIPSLLTFGTSLFFEVWQYAALRANQKARAGLFGRVYGFLQAGLVAVSLVLILSSRFLVTRVFAADFAEATMFVPLLVIGAFFSSLSSFLGSVYMIKLQSRSSLFTALFGAAINLFLCLWWIPQYGTMGAVAATVIAYAAIFLRRAQYAKRALPFSQRQHKLWLSVLSLLTTAGFVMQGRTALAIVSALSGLLPFAREYLGIAALLVGYVRAILKKTGKISKKI